MSIKKSSQTWRASSLSPSQPFQGNIFSSYFLLLDVKRHRLRMLHVLFVLNSWDLLLNSHFCYVIVNFSYLDFLSFLSWKPLTFLGNRYPDWTSKSLGPFLFFNWPILFIFLMISRMVVCTVVPTYCLAFYTKSYLIFKFLKFEWIVFKVKIE